MRRKEDKPMKFSAIANAFLLGALSLAPALTAGEVPSQPEPRRPRGIYAKVNISEYITRNKSLSDDTLHANLIAIYQNMLANPAVSGLALQIQWDTLNPFSPANTLGQTPYQWEWLQDAFTSAKASQKTIQLIVTPGFQSPDWVLDQIDSCDGTFPTPPSTCGKVTFTGFTEHTAGQILPLPWNPVYKSAWQGFLTALASKYGSNPLLVSIAVAGPTAASEEMILPGNGNADNPQTDSGLSPNKMWLALLKSQYGPVPAPAFSGLTYQNSDQAFIDEWDAAIDMYGKLFSNLTLIVTTGSGLPNLNVNPYSAASGFNASDCGNPNMDCAAETTILAYFGQASIGTNAKATQTSGLKASTDSILNLGLSTVKDQSKSTAQYALLNQILGGAQLDTSFSDNLYHTLREGCTVRFPPAPRDAPAGCDVSKCTADSCPAACIPKQCLAPGAKLSDLSGSSWTAFAPYLITPEQAEANVLKGYFGDTAVATFFGGALGTVPLNYLQIYYPDFQYADPMSSITVLGPPTTAQSILDLARQKLLEIAEPIAPPAPGQSIPMLIRIR
jgi:hypothetical protein